jgi:hypothetical protein
MLNYMRLIYNCIRWCNVTQYYHVNKIILLCTNTYKKVTKTCAKNTSKYDSIKTPKAPKV